MGNNGNLKRSDGQHGRANRGKVDDPPNPYVSEDCPRTEDTDTLESNSEGLSSVPGNTEEKVLVFLAILKRKILFSKVDPGNNGDTDLLEIVLEATQTLSPIMDGIGWCHPMPRYIININGYPGDKAGRIMKFPCDIAGGTSGSGAYAYFPYSQGTKHIIYGFVGIVAYAYYCGTTSKTGSVNTVYIK